VTDHTVILGKYRVRVLDAVGGFLVYFPTGKEGPYPTEEAAIKAAKDMLIERFETVDMPEYLAAYGQYTAMKNERMWE